MQSADPRCYLVFLASFLSSFTQSWATQLEKTIPILNLPDQKIVEVYGKNWMNTLKPCTHDLQPADLGSPHSEADRRRAARQGK